MNGSSPDGRCSSISHYNDSHSRCEVPTSSVLFDGNIPTLTGLDEDMWASQLLTLQIRNLSGIEIISDFTGMAHYTGVERVELVMFNCPELGIAVQAIGTWRASSISGPRSLVGSFSRVTSCDSLVRVCASISTTEPVIYLQFFPAPGSNWIYLAEVRFYGDNETCPQDAIITAPPPPAAHTTTPPPPNTAAPPPPDTNTPLNQFQCLPQPLP